jgi:hypothetical protein
MASLSVRGWKLRDFRQSVRRRQDAELLIIRSAE